MAALNPDEQLIEMPRVTLAPTPAPQPPSVLKTEGQAPVPTRLVGHGNAALGEEVLDVPKTEAEPVLQPHCVTDDLGRKLVSSVGWHTVTVPGPPSS